MLFAGRISIPALCCYLLIEFMTGIKIQDSISSPSGGSFLSFDLRDILAVVGEAARASRWRCRDLCYTEVRDGGIGEFREDRRKFSGEELIRFAAKVHQTIDGRFEARSGGAAKHPWLIISAVDSSWFEVWSSKLEVLESLKARFQQVSDISGGAA